MGKTEQSKRTWKPLPDLSPGPSPARRGERLERREYSPFPFREGDRGVRFLTIPNSSLLLGLIVLIASLPLEGCGGTPGWINVPPTDARYMYFVGASSRVSSIATGKKEAVDAALSDLLNYFGFTSQSQYNEKKTELYTQATSEIQMDSVKAQVKGILVQEVYYQEHDDGTYTVFVLLQYPKAEFQKEKRRMQAEESQQVFQANTVFEGAKAAESRGDLGAAISGYLSTVSLASGVDSGRVLVTLALGRLNTITSELRLLKVSGDGQKANISTGLKAPLVVQAVIGSDLSATPVVNLPIQFEFVQGSGILDEGLTTDTTGQAACRVTRITSFDSQNVVRARIRLDAIQKSATQLEPEMQQRLQPMITLLNERSITFQFAISTAITKESRTLVWLTEQRLGRSSEESIVGNLLAERLQQAGYNVVSLESIDTNLLQQLQQVVDPNQLKAYRTSFQRYVDFLVSGKVSSRQGSHDFGIISCLADARVQVTSMATGTTIASKNLLGVKGFGETEEQASRDALVNLSEPLNPVILQQIAAGGD
ncbi:hypothetical protein HYR99_39030 [Candidatus Poribacteria bacterium]|nr:hypothetical protein [Candidatus Poribacteria bacterium]